MTFIQQVEDLVGDQASGLDTAILQYLTASAREVQSVLPPRLKMRYGSENVLNNADGLDVSDKEVVNIELNGRSVSEVPLGNKADVEDTNSLHFATARTPVYYMQGVRIMVKPNPTPSAPARLYTLSYPTVGSSDTEITNMPSTAYYAVVLGAAIKFLQNVLNTQVQTDEDVELAQGTSLQIQSLTPLYTQELQRIGALI
tara:strand:+ start:2883 stop:3482 length:600 start_codon:yes stop_codon:yes gene_type:complete